MDALGTRAYVTNKRGTLTFLMTKVEVMPIVFGITIYVIIDCAFPIYSNLVQAYLNIFLSTFNLHFVKFSVLHCQSSLHNFLVLTYVNLYSSFHSLDKLSTLTAFL
ncbi:hypothetical protein GKR41_00290 [Candidatus Vallotia lariciata]|nr:hypothetical protein GKR41_00290 [Candidatus Vallotia lariciata]